MWCRVYHQRKLSCWRMGLLRKNPVPAPNKVLYPLTPLRPWTSQQVKQRYQALLMDWNLKQRWSLILSPLPPGRLRIIHSKSVCNFNLVLVKVFCSRLVCFLFFCCWTFFFFRKGLAWLYYIWTMQVIGWDTMVELVIACMVHLPHGTVFERINL